MTKDNKVLKRRSQALLPFIPELPENLVADLGVDPDPDGDSGEDAVLQGQAQIKGTETYTITARNSYGILYEHE